MRAEVRETFRQGLELVDTDALVLPNDSNLLIQRVDVLDNGGRPVQLRFRMVLVRSVSVCCPAPCALLDLTRMYLFSSCAGVWNAREESLLDR